MSNPTLSLVHDAAQSRADAPARPLLGDVLVAQGSLTPADLAHALERQGALDARLGEILRADAGLSDSAMVRALEAQWGAARIDLDAAPPDPDLIRALGHETCLAARCIPWRRIGAVTVVAAVYPDRFVALKDMIEERLGPTMLALVTEAELTEALARALPDTTRQRMERRVPEALSCRTWPGGATVGAAMVPVLGIVGLALTLAPAVAWTVLTALALCALVILSALKTAACVAVHRRPAAHDAPDIIPLRRPFGRLPVVSLLVPLHDEARIAETLVARLSRLRYPKPLLDICLTVEESDRKTRMAVAATPLPAEMRVIVVPDGALKTKPRALNFALDHVRGSIVGVYDAEDAPDPDQIDRVVDRFRTSAPHVACLQGRLSFYNTGDNWLSRCFTIDYAMWFAIVLPGLSRLGLPVPLGGTTLFFRRSILEDLGAWDAHNVTEDADLGIRLARRGYRTDLIDTTTQEEANAWVWPWIRQRSRWLKGYLMTYATHMRAPRVLWRDLGPRGFLAFQVLFLVTLVQMLLAPVLWTWWAVPFVAAHPLHPFAGTPGFWVATGLMIASGALNLTIATLALRRTGLKRLLPWALTLTPYLMLASVALAKALVEMAVRPFFWDKTAHGVSKAALTAPPASAPA